MGNSSVLYTSWTEPPGGRDHYRMILYSLDPPGMKRVHVIGPSVQDFLWTDLPAGSHFAVQVISVKGHAEASSTIAAEWTCESYSLGCTVIHRYETITLFEQLYSPDHFLYPTLPQCFFHFPFSLSNSSTCLTTDH